MGFTVHLKTLARIKLQGISVLALSSAYALISLPPDTGSSSTGTLLTKRWEFRLK